MVNSDAGQVLVELVEIDPAYVWRDLFRRGVKASLGASVIGRVADGLVPSDNLAGAPDGAESSCRHVRSPGASCPVTLCAALRQDQRICKTTHTFLMSAELFGVLPN